MAGNREGLGPSPDSVKPEAQDPAHGVRAEMGMRRVKVAKESVATKSIKGP